MADNRKISRIKIGSETYDLKVPTLPLENLVDGSATGSVRGVGTAEETSDFVPGQYSFAEGHETAAKGNVSHAEGYSCVALGAMSHAEGNLTKSTADNAHAEGGGTTASGNSSHAEGGGTTASSYASHAEGSRTTASGQGSHAEGGSTTASGTASHAEGGSTVASGTNAHAEGQGTRATQNYQHVEGRYNVEDTNNKYAHIIGNGTGDSHRSNAFTVDWDGNVNIASGAKYKINGTNLSYSDVGAASASHAHNTSITDSTATSSKTLALGGKYSLNTGGTSYVFTMPAKPTYTYSDVGAAASDHNHDGVYLKTAPVTSVNSKTGAVTISASDVGLENVGNFKAVSTVANQGLTSTEQSNARANIGAGTSSLTIGTTATTAAAGNHTHSASIATSTGTSSVTLAHGTKYALTAGGSSVVFTMPSDNNTNYYHTSGSWSGLKYTATANGGAGELSFTIPTGTTSTTVAVGNHTHSQYLTSSSSLDATKLTGEVPSSSLPSYVDDVLEYTDRSSFPETGESGKIYVDASTNLTYRWSGTAYVEISPSLALGTTSSTAFRGDYGNTAYTHSQVTSGNPHNVTKSDIGLGSVGNFKAVSTVASQGLSSTEQSNARANIGAGTSNLTIGTTSTTAAAGNHTHTTTLATDTGTSSITLASNTKYKLTTGGTSVIFTMPTIPTVPTATGNSETGISISDHGTTSVGSASSWNAGTASTWAFEEVSIPNVTSAGSASTWTFSGVTVANSIAGAVDSTDSSQLNITLGTTSVQSKSGGSNGTAPTLGTAIKVQSKKSGANSTVPSLKITSTTVVNGKTHSIIDNGHTHTI